MKRTEVKEKLDEIMSLGANCTYSLDEKEYNLIIDTVWQLSIGLDENDSIRPKEFKEKLRQTNGKDRFVAKVLDRLLKECSLKTRYRNNGL